jgi:hypothetical protein
MPKRKDTEGRYKENIRKEQRVLEEYAAHEIEWADDLLLWYKVKHKEIPDDEYRGVVFFKNREYLRKPRSLALLYRMYCDLNRELPASTKETAFYLLAYRYKMYAEVLQAGGFS